MNIAWWIIGKELPIETSTNLGNLAMTSGAERRRHHRHTPPPLRPRALNRWLRRINLDLEAAHHVRMGRVFDDLVVNRVPLERVAVLDRRPPLCRTVLVFSNGVQIRLSRCELRAVVALAAVPPGQVLLERVLHNGTFWAMCFRSRSTRLSIFSSDASPS